MREAPSCHERSLGSIDTGVNLLVTMVKLRWHRCPMPDSRWTQRHRRRGPQARDL
jgi:hypothetical protein